MQMQPKAIGISLVGVAIAALVCVGGVRGQEADAWAAERARLLERRRAAAAEVRYLAQREALAAERVAALEARVTELERRLHESVRLEASLEDTLAAVYARLAAYVNEDLPFLPDERQRRLGAIRGELARPDIASSEKLRRLLEALQIETAYGSAAEVYEDRVAVRGDSLFVEVLRVGRLSLFWRTSDGARVGEYDRASATWLELPGRDRRSIGQAFDMVLRRRPNALVNLPLGRIAP